MKTWWSKTNPPSRSAPSARMLLELEYMKAIFNPKVMTHVPSSTTWDVDFFVETKSIEFNTDDPSEPYWLVTFRFVRANSARVKGLKGYDPKAPTADHHVGDWYTVSITHSGNYPDEEPVVKVESDNVSRSSLHMFRDGRLCLLDHTRMSFNGNKHTASTVGLWTIQWLRAYAYHELTSDWPEPNG